MTSAEIRQSFLDFFSGKQHSIVASASLMPDSPGLLFTNAGMNQFVPIFLNEIKPDAAHRSNTLRPAADTRAADTQKCIRAGGKHNDLEDVGYDTYHHTLFEMLGNWSFGDYFKNESLNWGWELLTKVWGIPAKRLFATVYSPDKTKNDPAEFDQEAYDIWAKIFTDAGLDPAVHIVNGNKKDNFWMMGDTGPCGPCSEIHFNLSESDDESAGRALVNGSSSRCIEIWNHVFIQFNANPDGTLSPLPAKHVDTGMGFERVAGIHATTKGFTDFSAEPSNYSADVFTPLFKRTAELSGMSYRGTVPATREKLTAQEKTDIAFRVIADHARTVSCAIADGILPGNEGRNYVIRRILRRGILYGHKDLGLKTGFFEKLVPAVVETLGAVFPELKQQQNIIERVIRSEEESFGKTLDRGLQIFNSVTRGLEHGRALFSSPPSEFSGADAKQKLRERFIMDAQLVTSSLFALKKAEPQFRIENDDLGETVFKHIIGLLAETEPDAKAIKQKMIAALSVIDGRAAFGLYDTYGFPLDMTQLLAVERGLNVDTEGFETEMEKQRAQARAAQKKDIIEVSTDDITDAKPTQFVGYDSAKITGITAQLLDTVKTDKGTFLVFDRTPFYAEMGGQLGDTGTVTIGDGTLSITDTIKDKSGRHLHKISEKSADKLPSGNCTADVTLAVDVERRQRIQRHHTATHLLHWALRQLVGTHIKQAGSLNAPDRLRFDFSHFEAVPHDTLRKAEAMINARILENAKVESYETDFDKKPEDTLAFFGEKYGKRVRVVDIGGYSRELCGGTHVAATGEVGLFKIVSEGAIAAGTRRIEALAGESAYQHSLTQEDRLATAAKLIESPLSNFDKKLEQLVAQKSDLEKKLRAHEQRAAGQVADTLAAKAIDKDGVRQVAAIIEVETPEALRTIGSQILSKIGDPGVVQLAAIFGDKASIAAFASPAAIKAGHQAGQIVKNLCAQIDGKGGGKPDFAMGGGKDTAKLRELLEN